MKQIKVSNFHVIASLSTYKSPNLTPKNELRLSIMNYKLSKYNSI